jgi:hypothetical protein
VMQLKSGLTWFISGWDSTTNQPGFARVCLGNYSFGFLRVVENTIGATLWKYRA